MKPEPVCLWQLLAVDDLVGNLQTPLININRCIRWINVWEKKIANIYSKPTMSLKWTGFFFSENCSITVVAMKEFFIWINTSHAPLFVSSIFWLRWEQCSSFSLSIFNIEYTYLVLEYKLFRRWVAWYQIGIKIQKNRRNELTRYHHISRFFISSKWTAKLLFWLFYLPFLVWFYRIFSHFDHIAHIFE